MNMKILIVSLAFAFLSCIGMTLHAASRLDVVAENNILSATLEEMADADTLVVTGKINEAGLRLIAEACSLEGKKIRVLDMRILNVEDYRFPEDLFYHEIPVEGLGISETTRATVELDRIILPEVLFTVGDRAFMNVSCKKIDFPNRLEKIGRQSFANCLSTEFGELIICENVGEEAFINCPGITSVVLTSDAHGYDHNIGKRAFKNCSNLKSIDLGTGTVTMGEDMLAGTSIEEITIPVGALRVSLSGMSKLKKIFCNFRIPITLIGDNDEVLSRSIVYVPEGSREIYYENNDWSFAKEIIEDKDLDHIGIYDRYSKELNPLSTHMLYDFSISCEFFPILNKTIYLYEEGMEEPFAYANFKRNYQVNCLYFEAFFNRVCLDRSKKYTLIIPYGTFLDTDRGQTNDTWSYSITWDFNGVKELVGVDDIVDDDSIVDDSDIIFNLQGLQIDEPRKGLPFIKDGKLWIKR